MKYIDESAKPLDNILNLQPNMLYQVATLTYCATHETIFLLYPCNYMCRLLY